MAEIQAMFPVYLARRQKEDMDAEDYNTAIAQNENLLNQNFDNLFSHTRELLDTVTDQAHRIAALESALQALREGK